MGAPIGEIPGRNWRNFFYYFEKYTDTKVFNKTNKTHLGDNSVAEYFSK